MIDKEIRARLEKRDFTREDEISIFKYYEENPTHEMKEAIALRNIRLIDSIIRKNSNFMPEDAYDDLWQEGFIGLYTAINRYDYKKGTRFSSYAYHYIYRYMYMYLTENKMIRLPRHLVTSTTKVLSCINAYVKKNGEEPTPKYISETTGVTPKDIETILLHYNIDTVVSLDKTIKISEDGEANLLQVLRSEDNIEYEVMYTEDMKHLLKLIKEKLTAKEYEVIMKRYGFEGKAKTLMEIGDEKGVSRERIRQIETKALKKIRFIKGIKEWKNLQYA